ncbi:MAG TPA: hypothetical protein VFH82_00470 [Gemmatimonadota bacterium]|nr:hypothetical protein [Gemmatimonadota bacterium]
MDNRILCAILVSTSLVIAACGKKEAPAPAPAPVPAVEPAPAPVPAGVSVSSVTTGSAIGEGNKVTTATTNFMPADTMYVSVETIGGGTATLAAKWTYHKDGNVAVVKEDSMKLETYGPATNQFHVSKPDGWPAGDYQVEITLDGQPAGTKTLTVK